MSNLGIYLENNRGNLRLITNQVISAKVARSPLHVTYDLPITSDSVETLLTIVMYDPDAPTESKESGGTYLHWLQVNQTGLSENDGDIIIPYTPPHPPPRTGIHHYWVKIYQQNETINPEILTRENFNPDEFAQYFQLQEVNEAVFMIRSAK